MSAWRRKALQLLLAQPGDDLLHGMNAVIDFCVGADFPVAAGFGDCDGDGLFVDIKADIQ